MFDLYGTPIVPERRPDVENMQCTGGTDGQRAVDRVSWQPTTRRLGGVEEVVSVIPPSLQDGVRIVKLSADFRL